MSSKTTLNKSTVYTTVMEVIKFVSRILIMQLMIFPTQIDEIADQKRSALHLQAGVQGPLLVRVRRSDWCVVQIKNSCSTIVYFFIRARYRKCSFKIVEK